MRDLLSNQQLRVLHVVLDMDLGGLQRIVHLMIKNHNSNRVVPFLCALDRGGLFFDGLMSCVSNKWVLGRRPGPFDWRVFVGLYKIVRQNRIDVIHSHNGCSSYSVLAGRLGRVRAIVHTDHGRLIPDRRTAILEDRIASYFMDRFVGVANELTQYLAGTLKVNQDKLQTIINGVDTIKFVPVSADQKMALKRKLGCNLQSPIIGTVCRLDPIKNLEFLLECLPPLTQRFPNLQLVIVGDGIEEGRLRKCADTWKVAQYVLFTGRMNNIEEVLPVFDAYVCSSLSEGTSMTILEAMSCGLPVIATAVGGNVGLIDSTNGALYDLSDTQAFVAAVIQLLSDSNRREHLGRAGREKAVSYYGIRQTVKQYEDLYDKVVCGH